MKKVLKALAVFAIIITLTCACGLKEESPIVGNWFGKALVKRYTYKYYIKIKKDNTYVMVTYKENEYLSTTKGEYEFKDSKLILYKNKSYTSWIEYDYYEKSNKLIRSDGYIFEPYDGDFPTIKSDG